MAVALDVLEAVRETARRDVAAHARSVDEERRFPEESLKALRESCGFGLLVPEASSGSGASLEQFADACEAIGGACASTGIVFLMHGVTAFTIASAGGAAADRLLRSLAEGKLGTIAFSERATGANFHSPSLNAERLEGRVRISGRKRFVTSGGHADLYLLLLDSESGEGSDLYVVERDEPGVGFDGEWDGLGMAGSASISMLLEEVELTEAARIGTPRKGSEIVFESVAPVFLGGLAAVNVGIAAAALATAVRHARTRRYADGGLLAEVQTIQSALAEMDMRVRSARLVVGEAARLADAGDPEAVVWLMEAKVTATEAARAVTETALEVAGGQGYTPQLPIERHLRDARAGVVMAPTNAILRSWIGKALTGLPVP
ncbi:MAG: acyl-CoA dehydrogenase family protein [Gaiellaceae bacterium]